MGSRGKTESRNSGNYESWCKMCVCVGGGGAKRVTCPSVIRQCHRFVTVSSFRLHRFMETGVSIGLLRSLYMFSRAVGTKATRASLSRLYPTAHLPPSPAPAHLVAPPPTPAWTEPTMEGGALNSHANHSKREREGRDGEVVPPHSYVSRPVSISLLPLSPFIPSFFPCTES